MFVLRIRAVARISLLMLVALGLLGTRGLAAQDASVSEITPHLLVFSTSSGNVVCSVGDDGALLIGTPSAASTAAISKILAERTSSAVRYVVIAPEDLAHTQGDAGWGKRGAFVAMQENALHRLGGHVMGTPPPLDPRLAQLGVDRPRVAFSEVLTFDLNGEAIHVVHQKPGFSDADALVHFHAAKLVYMGEVFPGDGYPMIDPAQGGTLEGLLNTIEFWTADAAFKVVPARGPVSNGQGLKEFYDMIVKVRDRVKRSMDSGRKEADILAEHPTAEFDAKWGNGRVKADEFVREIYSALLLPKAQ
jgi:cyclase